MIRKKKKSRKLRGSRTHGYGAGKKHRGAGSRGGRGRAGSGKRGQQKKSKYLARHIKPLGRKGFKSVKQKKRKKIRIINLGEISKLAEKGIVDLTGYKLLGTGSIRGKLKVKVKHISKKAKEKLEKAGGEII